MTLLLNQQLICDFQTDAIWFLTRSFRMTSSISAEVLSHCFKVKSDLGQDLAGVAMQTVELLREILSFPTYNPNLPDLPDLSQLHVRPRSCTLEDIKEAARIRHMPGFSSISWQEKDNEQLMKVVTALNEYVQNDDVGSAINKLLFQKWFLAKQSRTPSVRSMDAGTRVEPFVIRGLMDFININNTVEDRIGTGGDEVYALNPSYLRTCGLFVDKSHGFLATSVDGLMSFKLSSDPDADFNMEETLIAGVEIKPRTTLNTINELIDRTKKFGSMAFCKIDRENETSALYFHECIPLKADRQQVTLSFLSDHFVFTSD